MTRSRMLILKTGSAPEAVRRRFGDFEHWFERGLGGQRFDFETLEVFRDPSLPGLDKLKDYAGIVITGSPAMVSHRHDWSEKTAEWLREAIARDRLPVLGVCYGHQLMAHALGGRVGPNPNGRAMGTREFEVESSGDDLIECLAPQSPVHVTHLEVVLDPPGASRVLGSTVGDAYHALHFGGRSWGVQFHPEFDAAIMRSYVEERTDMLEGEGIDSRAVLEQVSETSAGDTLLGRFADICEAKRGRGNGPGR